MSKSKQKSILSFFAKSDQVNPKKNNVEAKNPKKRYIKTRINNYFQPKTGELTYDDEDLSQEEEEEEDEELLQPKRRKKNTKIKLSDDDDDNDNDNDLDNTEVLLDSDDKEKEEEVVSVDSDSKDITTTTTITTTADDNESLTNTQEDSQDIRSDLKFLDKSDILNERTRGKQESRYSIALSKLKDRKSKLASFKGSKGPMDRYNHQGTLSDSENGVSSSSDEEAEYESDGEDDFIVDDDIVDGVRVTTATTSDNSGYFKGNDGEDVEMPAEFSSRRTQSWSNQFKTFIMSLVHEIYNDSNEQSQSNKYEMAERVVVGRIEAYKDSIVTSDVWLPHFKEALDKKQIWVNGESNHNIYTPCEGCRVNRNTHGRKVVLRSEGNELEPSVVFFLGSDCYRKSKMYHHLTHFKFHMYTKVNQEINKIISYNENELTEDDICNELIDSGTVKRLYKDLKSFLSNLVLTYNIKSERFRFGNDSSSSSSEDET